MLLPRDVHEAFDSGHLIFVPVMDKITCFVLPSANMSRSRAAKLHYKRQLAYFAWRAKGRTAVPANVALALDDAMSASASEEGNSALRALHERMRLLEIV